MCNSSTFAYYVWIKIIFQLSVQTIDDLTILLLVFHMYIIFLVITMNIWFGLFHTFFTVKTKKLYTYNKNLHS